MRKRILGGLMALPFNPCVYGLVFPVTANFLLASPSWGTVKQVPSLATAKYSSLLYSNRTIAHSPYFTGHDLGWDKLASRDEQQPGRECVLLGRCKG